MTKREIYLSEIQIDAKLGELRRLERLEHGEEQRLMEREGELDRFRDQFRAFLEGDGCNTMVVRAAAEAKCRRRMALSAEINDISSQNAALQSEIARATEGLEQCQTYKAFLEELTPRDWRAQHPFPEVYFRTPDQLLDILRALEEQTMFLISHCEEAEETFQRCRYQFNQMMGERDGSITEMEEKKAQKRVERNELEGQTDCYRHVGGFRFGNELPEADLAELRDVIRRFHDECGFDTAANDTVLMLTRIENLLEGLMKKLEKVNPQLFKEKMAVKAANRREQERTEKNIREKKEQDDKAQKTIQLAMMPIKKRTRRPLMERATPRKGATREKREEAMKLKQQRDAADAALLFGPVWD
jgi:hypothetical protein